MMHHPDAPADSDAGFTLPELLMVVLLISISSGLMLTSMISLTSATTSAQTRSEALASARTAVEIIARDLRAANPIDVLSDVSQYPTTVEFSVYCSTPNAATACGSDRLRPIRYQLVDNELRRTVGTTTKVLLGPSGPSSLPRQRQRSAVVNRVDTPIFSYFDQNGDELAVSGPATNFRNCTKAVRIRVAVVSDVQRADRDVDLSTTVNLRNYNKVSNCTL